MYCVYVLRSLRNGKHYIGMTGRDPNIRLSEHLRGTAPWTHRNGPFELVYQEEDADKEFVRKREKYLKSGHGREFLKKRLSEKIPNSSAGIAQR